MWQPSRSKRSGFVLTAIAAMVFLFAAGTAQAGGYKKKHHGHKNHGSYSQKHKYHGGYGKKHHGKHHRKHKSKTVIIFGSSGYTAFSYPAYPRRRHYFITDAPVCRVVSKIGYWYGHKAVIGRTVCPDAFGNYYTVKGSGYLIRHLY